MIYFKGFIFNNSIINYYFSISFWFKLTRASKRWTRLLYICVLLRSYPILKYIIRRVSESSTCILLRSGAQLGQGAGPLAFFRGGGQKSLTGVYIVLNITTCLENLKKKIGPHSNKNFALRANYFPLVPPCWLSSCAPDSDMYRNWLWHFDRFILNLYVLITWKLWYSKISCNI